MIPLTTILVLAILAACVPAVVALFKDLMNMRRDAIASKADDNSYSSLLN